MQVQVHNIHDGAGLLDVYLHIYIRNEFKKHNLRGHQNKEKLGLDGSLSVNVMW